MLACAVHAQIRTDGSIGRPVQSLTGPNYAIPEALGALRGANLFHSFSVFGIGAGESATFTTSTPGIANVISRVTGGEASLINGTLRLAAADGAPGFYFINPAGVVFGGGAAIDVPGGFHVSTADYVKFGDGAFHASVDAQSTLSSAAPEAFGFLGAHRAPVAVRDGARLSTALLQPFSIVAGDVTIDNGRVATRSGDIRIVAVGGGAAEVAMAGGLPAAHGNLAVVNGGAVTGPAAGTANAGSIDLAAGDVTLLNGGFISSSTSSSGNGGSISLSAASLHIDAGAAAASTGIFATANAGSTGDAGSIDVRVAGNLDVIGGGAITTGTLSSGNAGAVHIGAGTLLIDGRGINTTGVASQAQSESSGNAGSVVIESGNLEVINRGQVSTSTFGSGAGGSLTLDVGALRVFNGGLVASSTTFAGNAGSVRIDADTIVVDGNAGASGETAIVSNAQSGTGDAGSVDINARRSLAVLNGGSILSHTFSSGRGGTISIHAQDMLLDSMGHERFVTTVASNTYEGTGDAGNVFINVPGTLSVLNGGEISSSTFSAGNARAVEVTAGNIVIDGYDYARWATGIFSVADSGTGNAGTVNVTASGDILMRSGANIASGTFSPGRAGDVRVTARNLTIDGAGRNTPISSNSNTSATGAAGRVEVNVAERLEMFDDAFIGSSTFSSGNAGSVRVRAGDIVLDGQVRGASPTISSQANEGSGNGGSVDVAASGSLVLLRNGAITSSTFSDGNAGPVTVSANDITIEGFAPSEFGTGILSNAYAGSGSAGPVTVTATGAIDIRPAGEISSSTYTTGNAGTVSIRAGSMSIDAGGDFGGVFSQAIEGSGNAGTISIDVSGPLAMRDRGQINSSTFTAGHAGEIHVSAGDITIDHGGLQDGVTGIVSQADAGSTGNAGTVDVSASGRLSIFEGGAVSSSTFGPGKGGSVSVRARDLLVDGRNHNLSLTGIASQAEAESSGNAGSIDVAVQDSVVIRDGGAISSSTFSTGSAGNLKVTAGNVTITRNGADNPTGIFSQAYQFSEGKAGDVEVRVRDRLLIADGGQVNSDTRGAGDAGTVRVFADKVEIDGSGVDAFELFSEAPGTGIFSRTLDFASDGNAGTVEVSVAGELLVRNGGAISSSTFAGGNAGRVKVDAGNIIINGEGHTTGIFSTAENSAEGDAGNVEIRTPGNMSILRGGEVGSSTYSFLGRAGSVSVEAGNLTIDTQGYVPFRYLIDETHGEFLHTTGITSRATIFSLLGGAGSVTVNVTGMLTLLNGAQIESSTQSSGPAGSVSVNAGSIYVDGVLDADQPSSINARAGPSSLGQTGSVNVTARDTIFLSNGGELSIRNDGQEIPIYDPGYVVRPTLLTVSSPRIVLTRGGSITAASTHGWDASNIEVNVGSLLSLTDSAVATSAVDGNGGSIRIAGEGAVMLRNSQVSTSVEGLQGNGGDITVAVRALVLDGGFIQANTAAADASGGNVRIETGALIPAGNTVFVGGEQEIGFSPNVFGLNVIQAAAPTGVSGTVSITTPSLDVSAGLATLSARVLDDTGIGRSLCETTSGSALAQAGRGAMPMSSRGFLRAEDPDFAAVADAGRWVPLVTRIACAR
jgi:filamentous hemagglutinin family protein